MHDASAIHKSRENRHSTSITQKSLLVRAICSGVFPTLGVLKLLDAKTSFQEQLIL